MRICLRALTAMDNPPPKTLAQQFPDDGLSRLPSLPPPPPRNKGQKTSMLKERVPWRDGGLLGAVFLRSEPNLVTKQTRFLGRSDLAAAHSQVVDAMRTELAACYASFSASRAVMLRVHRASGGAHPDGDDRALLKQGRAISRRSGV